MDDFNIDYLGDSAADDYPENHPPANPIRIAPPTSQPDKIDQRPRAVQWRQRACAHTPAEAARAAVAKHDQQAPQAPDVRGWR